jgi:hypothetical protein
MLKKMKYGLKLRHVGVVSVANQLSFVIILKCWLRPGTGTYYSCYFFIKNMNDDNNKIKNKIKSLRVTKQAPAHNNREKQK